MSCSSRRCCDRRRYPALVSPGLLALGFGLRHGVDCDHIAAIDNVARKLAYSGKPAALVGLWFSLGHSTMVVLLCGIVAAGSSLIRSRVDAVASHGRRRAPIGFFHGRRLLLDADRRVQSWLHGRSP